MGRKNEKLAEEIYVVREEEEDAAYLLAYDKLNEVISADDDEATTKKVGVYRLERFMKVRKIVVEVE